MKENINEEDEQDAKLPSIDYYLNNDIEEEQEEDDSHIRTETLDDILTGSSYIYNYDPALLKRTQANSLLFAKYTYITKDFFFMSILLLSPSLNFSWLYYPYLFLSLICYFLLFKSSQCSKKIKLIIEIIALIYSISLLSFKIYYVIKIKRGERYLEKKEFLIDLGIECLLKSNRFFFYVITFIGEVFVMIFSIISLYISCICSDFYTDENIRKNLTKEEFFKMMAICIYFVYFNVLGFAIFNRSILTLCYIAPLNLLLYFLSMNSNRRLIFYVFKTMCICMILAISIQIILINILNINSIRNTYITNDDMPYPKIVNKWTKYGINQAFNENMSIVKIACEFCAYFFSVSSLMSTIFSYKKLTYERMIRAYNNLVEKNGEEEEKEENIFFQIFEKIKNIFFNPSLILHICRISAILWLYFYQNFYSIGVVIWLFFAFLFKHIKSNRFVTITFLSPMVIVCLFCYHLSNIDGYFDDLNNKENNSNNNKILLYSSFGLKKFEHKIIEYILCNIFYYLINLFTYTIFIRIDEKAKKMTNKIKSGKNEEILEIKNDNIQKDKIKPEEDSEKMKEAINNISLLPDGTYKSEEQDIYLKDKEIEELYNNLTFFNIFLKGIFSIIDKLTLIPLYFLAVGSINIVHLFIVMIFMVQLLFPVIMIRYSLIMIIISQMFFLIEYLIHLFKINDYSYNTKRLIKAFIPFDSNSNSPGIEYLLYVLVYCYYFQYKLYNYDIYQKLKENENMSISLYIEIQLSEFPLIRNIIFSIGKIINELYIWSLIIIFIIFDSYLEISFLFAIKLLIFLFIVYNFLQIVRGGGSQKKNILFIWCFLIFCALNTICVYIFQILCLNPFPYNFYINNSHNFWILNLPALGFYRYSNEKQLYIRMLPHFISNIISVLLIQEMRRIIKRDGDIQERENGEKLDIVGDTKNKLLMKKKSLLSRTLIDIINPEENIEESKIISGLDSIITSSGEDKEPNIKDITEKNDKKEDVKKENEEEMEKISASQEYEDNKSKMDLLDIKYICFNIVLIFTKFYWLFLFLSICIIFTTYNLSILLIIYILIFGITFIRMFRHIISRLSKFIGQKSFFISRIIRYNLIEQTRHIKENSKYRLLAFKYLLIFSFSSYYLLYLYGIFYIVQHGCPGDGCDKNNKPFKNIDEDIIIAFSYIFGINVNLENESVLFAGWFHLFFAGMICFDVYVQKLENYFNDLCIRNRKEYKTLANRNVQLKPLTFGEDNILMNISSGFEAAKAKALEEEEKKRALSMDYKNDSKIFLKKRTPIKFNIDTKSKEEEKIIGQKLIESFLGIFEKASKANIALSKNNKKYIIVQVFKKIFEELIIFLLICTAISKLNIWSFVYMFLALFLIITERSMMKYYFLYCFIIATILLQSVLFVSNLQLQTDPNPDEEAILIMNRKFHIPWYKKNVYSTNGTNSESMDYDPLLNLSDQKAFFYGFGVSHSQINLIWMDFIEVVIIYIYLDYFSYSIYQEVNSIGNIKKAKNKINYYNLYLNPQIREISSKMTSYEYKKHIDCMKYNFDLDILDYDEFKYYMQNGKRQVKIEQGTNKNKDEKKEDKIKEEDKMENNKDGKKEDDKKLNKTQIIKIKKKKSKNTTSSEDINITSSKSQKINENNITNANKETENAEEDSPVVKALNRVKTMAVSKSSIISNLQDTEKFSNKLYNMLIQFTYLSIHNIILIVIIIVSMMISGLISVYYILFSFYFLITSTRLYLGNKYYYPKAIKKILRICILVDISLQILYQAPYIDSKNASDNKNSTFYIILNIIGLNKILSFDWSKGFFDSIVDWEQMILVMAKAFIYLFMSIQVLVYSSQNFQEYYLSFIITKNNNLRRTSLMNVFKFNNKRIQVLENSIQIRHDMSMEMGKIEKTLEKWNEKLKKFNKTQSNLLLPSVADIKPKKLKSTTNIVEDENEYLEKKDSEEKSKIVSLGANFLSNIKKLKDIKELNNISEEKDNIDIKPKEQSNEIKRLNLFEKNPFDDEEEIEEYVPEEIVLETIKKLILGGFLINLQIKLHRYAAEYNNISKKERDIYEKDTIQGKIETTSYIENFVEKELKALDLAHFTEEEMSEVKSFFDGTRKKKLEKRKKEKEIKQKMQKSANKVKFIGKINKMEDISQKKNYKFGLELILSTKENSADDAIKKKMKKNKTEGLLTRSTINYFSENEEKNDDIIINLNAPKFKKLEKFMSNKIFIKYLTAKYIIASILKDCLSFCSNNFHWVCYTIMILNHIMSSSILSLFYPLSIFCYAILEYPRPPRAYWSFCFIYTVALSILKFGIQLKFLNKNGKFVDFIEKTSHYKLGLRICNNTFSKDFFLYILFDSLVLIILLINNYLLVFRGLYLKREQEIENIYQAMERVAMTKDIVLEKTETIKNFNDSYLLKEGKKLERKKENDSAEEENDLEEGIEIVQKFSKVKLNDSDFDKEKESKPQKKKVGFLEKIKNFKNKRNEGKDIKKTIIKKKEKKNKKKEAEKVKEKEKEKYDEANRTYFQKLLPKIRNEKPGNEYYVSYTLTMVFIIIYLLIFYTTMIQDKTYGAVTVETKQFSGEMVLFLLLHIVFLVYDRILFISQNRNNIEFEYILYNKITKRPLSELEFNQLKSEITKEYPNMKRKHFEIPPEYCDKLKKKYNIVYIQKEEFNCPLFQKYILQILIVVFGHIFIFFFMPMIGNLNLNNNIYCSSEDEVCNDFLYNKTLIFFYLLYLLYFVSSGLQVKYGFYDMKRISVLKAKSNSISGIIYNTYKALPFLYEIKLGIDWTFTSTCLDLFQWNKFESVYDLLFITNCQMSSVNIKPIGQEVGKIMKIFMGGFLSFGLVLVLVIPLILFSSLNPMNQLNNLTSADLKVELSFTNSNGIKKGYTIFQNSKPQSIDSITEKDFNYYNYSKSLDTKNFPRKQIQTVLFSEENERNWDLSSPQINSLINLIRNRNNSENSDIDVSSIDLVIDYGFHRLLPPGAQEARKLCIQNIYSKEDLNEENNKKLDLLENALSNCTPINLTFNNIISPPIRLKGSSIPTRLKNKNYFPNLDVQLGFVGCQKKYDETAENNTRISYIESYFLFGIYKGENETEGIIFHVFSDQVSSTTFSYSVLTFYVAFVLVIGNYVRNFFTGQPEKISLTEMPHNEELLKICEGIKVSRYRFNYDEEEKLYYILIEIMRSPDYLRLLTSSSIDQFSQRLKLTKSKKTTDDIE